jgi:hypothetical protein
MINFYDQNKKLLLKIRRSYFLSSQLLSSFQIITSQNQARINSPNFTAFGTSPLILPKNYELGAMPNGILLSALPSVLPHSQRPKHVAQG